MRLYQMDSAMVRYLLLICLLMLPTSLATAQQPERDYSLSEAGYVVAVDWIEDAYRSGATHLDLSHLHITALPPEIGLLTRLEELNLYNNRLTALPAEFSQLQALEELNLTANQFNGLPLEVTRLSNLELLGFSGIGIQTWHSVIESLTDERPQTGNMNRLTTLPPQMSRLENLRELDLSNNYELGKLPLPLFSLQRLERLDLVQAGVTAIPPEIRQLTNLQYLNLQMNQITHLPSEIGSLENLEYLSVFWNDLTHLPVELGQLENLSTLNIDRNPLVSPPPQVVAGGIPAIQDYLNNQAAWHLRRMIAGFLTGLALLLTGFLFILRQRRQRTRKRKQKPSQG